MKLILNPKIKYYTKEISKLCAIGLIGIGFIIGIILIKYKPIYSVTIEGEKVGNIQNKEEFKESLKENLSNENKNVDNIDIKVEPQYELKLANRNEKTDEEKVEDKIEENSVITYKYYDIAINNEVVEKVNTISEAEEVVKTANENTENENVELSIAEKYTQDENEAATTEVEIAKNEINTKIIETKEKQAEEEKARIEAEEKAKAEKEEQERINSMPDVNGIKLANLPITGNITSRYGESSRLRQSTHTGLDIAAKTGTAIKAVAGGTITCASYTGSYGNLVKIDHGNGVETWYGHTSKMYVKVGQKVSAGEVIAAVGSTGNSTGPHLHFEIRINGTHVNPQKYLYK